MVVIKLLKAIVIIIAAFVALFGLIYLTKGISSFLDKLIIRKKDAAGKADEECDFDGQETD